MKNILSLNIREEVFSILYIKEFFLLLLIINNHKEKTKNQIFNISAFTYPDRFII
jgi:hypothetical protein